MEAVDSSSHPFWLLINPKQRERVRDMIWSIRTLLSELIVPLYALARNDPTKSSMQLGNWMGELRM